jgi:hypothetical protein
MEIEFRVVGPRSVVLTDYGRLKAGRRGDLAPETTLETKRIGGQLMMSTYLQEKRPLDLPFLFKATTEAELLANVRLILDVLTAGEGTLKVTRNDDVVRELYRCFYRAGLGEKNWLQAAEAVLSFDALDPYWYDPTAVIVDFVSGGSENPTLFFPVPPLYLLPSSVLEQKTINNPGVEAWPVWTITGPGAIISLINQTSGRTFIYSGTLDAADTLEIDSRPLYKTVRLNGANAWANVPKASADLWPLAGGDNSILVTVANSTEYTVVEFNYYPRYVSL